MKNVLKLFGIIALVAIIGFSMAACDIDEDNDDNGTPTIQSLDGIWERSGGMQITISGSAGVINAFGNLNALWTDAKNKNYIKLGDQHWKTITNTGNLTWSGQQLGASYNTSSPNVATGTGWVNCTFTMSANGQAVTVTGTYSENEAFTDTWTRSSYSLDGVWERSGGMQITVSGNAGIINAFGTLNALWTDAKNKNYIKLDDQHWKTITNTGNLTWSGQQLGVSYNTSSPNVATGTGWVNCTFTMSANGQTVTVTGTYSENEAFTDTWTRKQ